jgi:amyloid beta precursor protein binding protein 1
MHSSTSSYLALQGLYRTQFQQDLQQFSLHLRDILRNIGLPEDAISNSEIASFVKNTNGVALIKGTSISSRRTVDEELKSMIGTCCFFSLLSPADDTDDNFGLDDWPVTYATPLHLALLAADQFHASSGRWPGTDASAYGADLQSTQSTLAQLVKADIPVDVRHCAQEMYVNLNYWIRI